MKTAGMTLLLAGLSLALALGGCASPEAETARGGVSAELLSQPGSCAADDCGAQSADGCWCDDLCDGYGDCCADKGTVCDGACAPVMCEMYCPFGFEVGDDGCEVCECKPSWLCAGFAPTPCPEGFVCEDIEDDCDPANGGADCGGICVVPTPTTCPDIDLGSYCSAVCSTGVVPVLPAGCTAPECVCPPPSATCDGFCGGANEQASCWCDDQCDSYGDCCPDKAAACDGASCAGHCGDYDASAACQCDDDCTTWGDCCDDHGALCSGCSYDGSAYGVGDTFPDVDGCNTCTCTVGGNVACTEMGCVSCEYGGEVYGEGQTFPTADGCNTCTCMAGGAVYCTSMPCYE